MSKSRKNVIDPNPIMATYGADTARWFMLSDSPPDRDLEWTTAGVEGAAKFAQRLWRLITERLAALPAAGAPMPPSIDARCEPLRRATHKTIAGVTDDIEKFHFNKAVARLYEFVNTITDFVATNGAQEATSGCAWALREAFEALTRLIGPMMPHLAEELWRRLGYSRLLVETPWPEAEQRLIVDDSVTIAVQVNGKLRATIELPRDAAQTVAESAALAEDAVQRALAGKPPRKVIIVPNRIVNVVV
jgi:leucyl-tRNA synthetase